MANARINTLRFIVDYMFTFAASIYLENVTLLTKIMYACVLLPFLAFIFVCGFVIWG